MMSNNAGGFSCPSTGVAGTHSPPITPLIHPSYLSHPFHTSYPSLLAANPFAQLQQCNKELSKANAELLGMLRNETNKFKAEMESVKGELNNAKGLLNASRNHAARLQGEIAGANKRRRATTVRKELAESNARAQGLENKLQQVEAENQRLRNMVAGYAAAIQQKTQVYGSQAQGENINHHADLPSFQHPDQYANLNGYQKSEQYNIQNGGQNGSQYAAEYNYDNNSDQYASQYDDGNGNRNGDQNGSEFANPFAELDSSEPASQYTTVTTDQQFIDEAIGMLDDEELLGGFDTGTLEDDMPGLEFEFGDELQFIAPVQPAEAAPMMNQQAPIDAASALHPEVNFDQWFDETFLEGAQFPGSEA
ncbi:hypothetical protein F4677DRAFT_462733 [Hypoxylon crocopeplum]|nr:hypothetical protein F4677DRAFT_462733 [Hypoxylon crocopeplum]